MAINIPITVIRDVQASGSPTTITVRIAAGDGRTLAARSYVLVSGFALLHDHLEVPANSDDRLRLDFGRGSDMEAHARESHARAFVRGPNHVLISQRENARINIKINHLAPGECELSCPEKGEIEVGNHGDCKACATPYGPIVICC